MANYNLFEITKDNVRLDSVVQYYYGDLSMFDAVLEANTHIKTEYLKTGDKLNMPEQAKANKDDILW